MKRLILYISLIVFFTACGQRKHTVDAAVYYTCSMDPEVVSDKPGNCPICGMVLTQVKISGVAKTDDL